MAKDQKKTVDPVVTAPTPSVTAPPVAPTVQAPPSVVPETTEGFVEIQEVILVRTGTGTSKTGTEEGRWSVVEVTLFAKPVAENTIDSNLSYATAKAIARTERAKRGGMERGL